MYQVKGDSQTVKEGNDLQQLLKPVFEGIADFLISCAKYYERLVPPGIRSANKTETFAASTAILVFGELPLLHEARIWTMSTVLYKRRKRSLHSCCGRFHRALLYIAHLSASSKDAHETRIATTRITQQCAELQTENTEIKKQNEEIKNQLRAQDEQTVAERLSHLKRLLYSPSVDEQTRKKQYEVDLQRMFLLNRKRVPKYQDVPRIAEKDASFLAWRDAPSSTVLVLSGHSSGTQPSQRFCWLSAAAIQFIDHLQASADSLVLLFNGQAGTTFQDWQARCTEKDALESMIVQLATRDPFCLHRVDHEQYILHKDWDCDDLKRKTAFLQALLNLYGVSKPVYLIIDNVKMDREAPTSVSRRSRLVLIRRLLELVRDVQGVVKILFVGLKEDFEEVDLDILRDTVDGLDRDKLLFRLAWDSAKIKRIPL
ncbi:MAG: hypothetical protein Q9168_005146 [Polycauliona sp. 1 TL-2023]